MGDRERSNDIRRVFSEIAGSYDLTNHLMSFGTDIGWRRRAAEAVMLQPGQEVLDMCCGTGDVAITFAKAQPGLKRVVGCDFSKTMVELAMQKQAKLAKEGELDFENLQWCQGDCLATEFADSSFDVVSCAFGLRNMVDLSAGLKEMHRVLKPNGRVCILEFSLPANILVRWGYLLYFNFVLPLVGGAISGKFSAYRYLVTSVRKWDREVDLTGALEQAGFGEINITPLTLGIAKIHIAHKR